MKMLNKNFDDDTTSLLIIKTLPERPRSRPVKCKPFLRKFLSRVVPNKSTINVEKVAEGMERSFEAIL